MWKILNHGGYDCFDGVEFPIEIEDRYVFVRNGIAEVDSSKLYEFSKDERLIKDVKFLCFFLDREIVRV